MKKITTQSLRPRMLRTLALVSILGLAATGLTQCRMVSDTVAGVDMTPEALHQRNGCVRQCNDAFEEAMERESQRHREALRKCGGDRTCRREEKDRHDTIKDAIKDARKECKRKCYNEGGGGGGR